MFELDIDSPFALNDRVKPDPDNPVANLAIRR